MWLIVFAVTEAFVQGLKIPLGAEVLCEICKEHCILLVFKGHLSAPEYFEFMS